MTQPDLKLERAAEIDDDVRDDAFRMRDVVRDVPRFVWVVTALHVAIMLLNVAAWAPNRGPDEFRHVGLSVGVASGAALPWPAPGEFTTTKGVSAGILSPRLAQGKMLFSAAAAPERDQWPSYNSRGGDTPGSNANQLVQHPPLFYYLMGGPLALVPNWADRPYIDVYLILRLLNVLMMAPITLLIYAAARRLLGSGSASLAASAAVLAIPQFARDGASVENDNLLILLLTLVTAQAVYVITGDTSRRTGALIGVTSALALLTKGLALFLPLFLVAVYGFALAHYGRKALGSAVLALAIGGLGGGWWWLRNLVVYGVIQPDGTTTEQHGLGEPITTFSDSGSAFIESFVRRMNYRFWLDGHIWNPPHWVEAFDAIPSLIVLVGVLAGLVTARRRPMLGSTRAFILLLPMCCLTGIVATGAWSAWQARLFPAGQQGRYVYGAVAALAIVAMAGLSWLLGRFHRALPLLVLLWTGVAVSVHFALAFKTYWTPAGGEGIRTDIVEGLRNMLAWSPMPAWAFWCVLVVTAVIATGAVSEALSMAMRQEDQIASPLAPSSRTHTMTS
jgi:4-amino-4-deoxy-L-arabinose transferase-like glycosyltransferase